VTSFFIHRFSDRSPPALQAPVRQFVRPKTKLQVSAGPANSTRPSAVPLRRGARTSISALPIPALTAALRITKKAKSEGVVAPPVVAPVPARPTGGGPATSSTRSALTPSTIALGGVQRPPVHAKVVLPAAVSARVPSQSNKQMVLQRPKVSVVSAGGSRPSGLRPPTSRGGGSNVAARETSTTSGPVRPSMSVGGGRLGTSGGIRAGGRTMMRRV
jgi:hypothetical protein